MVHDENDLYKSYTVSSLDEHVIITMMARTKAELNKTLLLVEWATRLLSIFRNFSGQMSYQYNYKIHVTDQPACKTM